MREDIMPNENGNENEKWKKGNLLQVNILKWKNSSFKKKTPIDIMKWYDPPTPTPLLQFSLRYSGSDRYTSLMALFPQNSVK